MHRGSGALVQHEPPFFPLFFFSFSLDGFPDIKAPNNSVPTNPKLRLKYPSKVQKTGGAPLTTDQRVMNSELGAIATQNLINLHRILVPRQHRGKTGDRKRSLRGEGRRRHLTRLPGGCERIRVI
jgi:hypothetical protein